MGTSNCSHILMKLAKYIGDLLYEYECIVIPDFGGFVTKNKPAEIQPVQNHFIPPKKEIVFNAHLKTNDGLLINHVARCEKLSYTDARIAVERFVKRCQEELKNGKRIRFQKVGTVYMGEEQTLQFDPDLSQNYLADSYGMNSFISPVISRSATRPISGTVRKDRNAKYVVREEAKKQHTPKYIRVNVSLIVITLAIAALLVFKYDKVKYYADNYASIIPFLDKKSDVPAGENTKIDETVAVITLVDKLNPSKGGKKTPENKNTNKNSQEPDTTEKTDNATPGMKPPSKKTRKTPNKKQGDSEKVIEEQKQDGTIATAQAESRF